MGKIGFISFAAIAAFSFYACDGDSNNAAEYDFEVVDDSTSAVVHRDTTIIPRDTVLFSNDSLRDTSCCTTTLQSSESSRPESSEQSYSSEQALPGSSIYDSYSSANFGPRSSSSPHSSDSKLSSAALPPQSSASDPMPSFGFYTGADISTVQEYERWGTKFYDVDGAEKDIFSLLKAHGFNAIRLKTFVSPKAKYGYAASGCDHDAEAYADKDHIIAYAKKIKAAGMAFLLDIHYSDNWADPGKQIIPSRWRNVQTSDAMADSVYAYTYDLISSLKQVNATPEMVQIGNETTPGIMMHVPNSNTDCWGNGVNKASASIGGDMGTSAGKANAAKYFKAGIRAVKAVSQNIKTVLHIESIRKQSTVEWWMTEIFKNQKVPADVMGFSAYTAYGDDKPDKWVNLFKSLSSTYPNLEFIVAEYNGGESDNQYSYDGSRKRTNEIVKGLDRWIGTFFWEPTMSGAWGTALFDWEGSNLRANKKAFDEYKVEF